MVPTLKGGLEWNPRTTGATPGVGGGGGGGGHKVSANRGSVW